MEAPVLWHMKVSNYNEKARWALDYKRMPHVRRAVVPGRHPEVARRLGGGSTLPILVHDGHVLADSTAIVAWLEEVRPEPALYPSDPAARQRALELEDFFDEELGPYVRRLVIHHLLSEPSVFLGAFLPDASALRRAMARATFGRVRRAVRAALDINPASVEEASAKVRVACSRFRGELQPSGYLVGDEFTVADLTAAALVAPAVAPPQFPYPQPQRDHPVLAPVREALAESGLLEWTRGMYALHRGASAEVAE